MALLVTHDTNPNSDPTHGDGHAKPQSHGTSDLTTNLDLGRDPFLDSFISALGAKEIPGPRDSRTLVFQPGVYTKTLESLHESNFELWANIDNRRKDLIDDRCLVIMTLTTIHEVVVDRINFSIQDQLRMIGETSGEATRQLIDDICGQRSRTIQLYHGNNQREPDGQFVVKGSYFPGVVFEVAHSEEFISLQKKAEDLILKSKGNIQLMIGLETGYKNKERSKISAWRPDFVRFGDPDTLKLKAVIEQDEIHDRHGKAKPKSLVFHLHDFGTDLATKYPNADLTKAITLHYHDLADYLTTAHQSDVPFPN